MSLDISSRGAQVIAWSYITFAIASLFVTLRILVRWKFVRLLGREDICVLGSLAFSLLCCIFMHLEVTRGGLGQRYDGPERLMEFLKLSYFSILFYNLSLCLSKFAILLLCLRIFAPSSWRYACYAVLAILSIYTAWIVICSIIACLPVPLYWDKSLEGWCFPKAVVWFTNAGLNIFTDFLIVLLPLPGIYKLQLPRKQKIGVSLVFLLGFFVCIISIVRLYALHTGSVTTEPTYDNFAIAIWSVVEVNGAIVGACLPTLKPLISRWFPGLLSSGHSRPRTNTHSYFRHGTGADGTSRSNASRERPIPDFSSATQILGDDDDGVVLEDMERKNGIQVRTEYEVVHEESAHMNGSSKYCP
ncbi:hypothetical protein BU24DRAFT_468309 [Aaosphaeria arxii CBS 175.79]|uniref:Rhodopsin domain-containing protein n=1 Tax=Aaosphaeria arxii CBS 175.79 TaxID=1450172 RepID=A0A6A5X8V4_9PLEO|nr:uncharacterized protein BU24DRAFT_468309 [Aaosphaeria arxii CBS 175.79]KAF2009340.1 hypothetical protein BU24DRAFT_468309 [Aaosphaeria arxii CBS 175.79]